MTQTAHTPGLASQVLRLVFLARVSTRRTLLPMLRSRALSFIHTKVLAVPLLLKIIRIKFGVNFGVTGFLLVDFKEFFIYS